MSSLDVSSSSILNRSPFVVTARSDASLNRRFSFAKQAQAQAYADGLAAKGIKVRLTQLEISFQLRVRRKGVPEQFITFDSFEKAEQTRLQIEAQLAVSIVRDYAVAAKTTLRDLLERYLVEVVPGHKGGDIESTRIRRLLREEVFVEKKLAALVTEDLQDYIQDRLTEVAPATVDRELDVISQALNYADDIWKIAPVESPFKGLRRPKYFNERDRRLSKAEEKALLDAARNDENPYLEPAIVLALETAMRRGELLSLRAADINFELRYAFLRETKNGRSRKVPLSTRAMQVIRALMELQADDSNKSEADGRLLSLTPNALKKGFFDRVIPKSGVVDLHFHDLRHEAISRFAESGRFGLLELQSISGHRDMRMLQRYAHLCAGNLAVKMDEIQVNMGESYVHRGRLRRTGNREEDGVPSVGPQVDHSLSPRPTVGGGATHPEIILPEPEVECKSSAASGKCSGQVINFSDEVRRRARA